MATVTVVGARGYLGREALRLLHDHPNVTKLNAVSLSGAGGRFAESVPSFRNLDLPLEGPDEKTIEGADVIFLATASGQAWDIAQRLAAQHDTMLVDLSRDHRLQALATGTQAPMLTEMASQGGGSQTTHIATGDPTTGGAADDADASATKQAESWPWVYGLPETSLAPKAGDRRIANPGCYPTAALLSVLPAVQSDITTPGALIVDGKSGASGAGATPRPDLHFSQLNENARAYKVVGHDHGFEMQAAVACATGDNTPLEENARKIRFTPHLVPMNRGLLTTSYIHLADGITQQDVQEVYEKAYADTPTVGLVDEPNTADLRGTVRAEIAVDVDPQSRILIVRAAIDNLVKGGSGQGVHNMNIAMGEEPTLGLPLLGGGP